MGWTIIAVLILIGLVFLVLEILVFPGQGIAGILGLIILGIAIWQTYKHFGPLAGHLTLGGTFILSIVLLVFSLRSGTWKKTMLKTKIDGKVNLVDTHKLKVGEEGKTISRLNPAGKAFINGDYWEVHTQGEYVEPHTDIIITKIEFNKIYVKPKT